MARYAIRPRSDMECDYWSDQRIEPVPTVSDHEAIDTGLLDADGNSIFRLPNPIGFGRDDEW